MGHLLPVTLEPLLNASPVIQVHVWAAFIALGLGVVMWMRPKGTRQHKIIGRGFVVFMLVVSFTAIFIRQINAGHFSWIHVFVPVTIIGAWQAIANIRNGNIKGHKRAVKGMFFGALLIPGVFSFLPGRLMWHVVFG